MGFVILGGYGVSAEVYGLFVQFYMQFQYVFRLFYDVHSQSRYHTYVDSYWMYVNLYECLLKLRIFELKLKLESLN